MLLRMIEIVFHCLLKPKGLYLKMLSDDAIELAVYGTGKEVS